MELGKTFQPENLFLAGMIIRFDAYRDPLSSNTGFLVNRQRNSSALNLNSQLHTPNAKLKVPNLEQWHWSHAMDKGNLDGSGEGDAPVKDTGSTSVLSWVMGKSDPETAKGIWSTPNRNGVRVSERHCGGRAQPEQNSAACGSIDVYPPKRPVFILPLQDADMNLPTARAISAEPRQSTIIYPLAPLIYQCGRHFSDCRTKERYLQFTAPTGWLANVRRMVRDNLCKGTSSYFAVDAARSYRLKKFGLHTSQQKIYWNSERREAQACSPRQDWKQKQTRLQSRFIIRHRVRRG